MTMDTDVQTLEASSSPPRVVRSRPASWSSSGSSGSIEYTSLRDVLSEAGPGSFADVHDFDTSSINIRNQLLKHAASAYLQSVIVVAPRDRGCLSRFWRRMLQRRRCRILLRPCAWPWPGCACACRDPAHRCAASVAGSARRLVAFLCVTCMCT